MASRYHGLRSYDKSETRRSKHWKAKKPRTIGRPASTAALKILKRVIK